MVVMNLVMPQWTYSSMHGCNESCNATVDGEWSPAGRVLCEEGTVTLTTVFLSYSSMHGCNATVDGEWSPAGRVLREEANQGWRGGHIRLQI